MQQLLEVVVGRFWWVTAIKYQTQTLGAVIWALSNLGSGSGKDAVPHFSQGKQLYPGIEVHIWVSSLCPQGLRVANKDSCLGESTVPSVLRDITE